MTEQPRRGWRCASLILLVGIGIWCAAVEASDPKSRSNSERVAVEEHVTIRLVQLDVIVTGASDEIGTLSADDFDVTVGGKTFNQVTVDNFCGTERVVASGFSTAEQTIEGGIAKEAKPGTYLFYFDQPHLTLAGRVRAFELARELARELTVRGSKALVVSNGRDLRQIAGPTEDPQVLLRAIDALETDLSQWDTWAAEEPSRLVAVGEALQRSEAEARSLALRYQREEAWQATKAQSRLAAAMSRLDSFDLHSA